MDSEDENNDFRGPNDRFFIDPDIFQLERSELGIFEEDLDDLFTVSSKVKGQRSPITI